MKVWTLYFCPWLEKSLNQRKTPYWVPMYEQVLSKVEMAYFNSCVAAAALILWIAFAESRSHLQ